MDEELNANAIFSRLHLLTKKQLKPRSVHSRMVVCEEKASPHSAKESSNPFVNLKIKIVNDSGRKRKLGDDKIRDYSSPHKRMCSSISLSPDLGCFMDYSKNNSLSPFALMKPTLQETPACRRESKATMGPWLDLEHVQCGYSKEEVEKTEEICKNMSSVFDHDVDDILCLNPPKQDVQEPTNKDENPAVGVVEDDNGYISSFYLFETEGCKTEGRPDQQSKQSSACGGHFSFRTADCETVSGPFLGPAKCDGEFLEKEVLNFGEPIFESSVCQPNAGADQKSGLSEALNGTFDSSHIYNSGDFTVDSLYETTLPLQVQLKSKVVVPSQMENIKRPASSSIQPGLKESSADKIRATAVKSTRHRRPKILDNSMEWEDKKRRYIFSVGSHMKENPGGAEGPMTELLDLMTHVAGQSRSSGHQWQHPSDLTCRNYQKRFRNETPTMTLNDWVVWNHTHYRRFSNVPKIFKRSSFP